MTNRSFGGSWTEQKLSILREYLNAYTTALKGQEFRLTYIDAFAGSGWYRSRQSEHDATYGDFDELRKGSASIALEITDRQFDRLIYVEKNADAVALLNRMMEENPDRYIEVIKGDANQELPVICESLKSDERAVAFLDPFATEVNWQTVEAIARTEKIDCWILFPISALTRMMDRDRRPNEALSTQLDRVFGGREYWQDQLYKPSLQQSLFEADENLARGSQGRISEIYRQRLESVFAALAPARRILTNSQNSPLFELIFAIASPNPRAKALAIRIADHILRRW